VALEKGWPPPDFERVMVVGVSLDAVIGNSIPTAWFGKKVCRDPIAIPIAISIMSTICMAD
jgi:hypothetical protein